VRPERQWLEGIRKGTGERNLKEEKHLNGEILMIGFYRLKKFERRQ
jgi:hypothetical protein